MSLVSSQYKVLIDSELTVAPLTSIRTSTSRRPSLAPILDDVTDGILFFHGMSGADANLALETDTDGIFDGTGFSVVDLPRNVIDSCSRRLLAFKT